MDSILKDYLGSAQLSASLIIPVVVVIISAVLVFLCGFRKPKEPQFRKIAASVEASSKKTKRKEKPQASNTTKTSAQNGAVKTVSQSAAPASGESKKQLGTAAKKDNQSQQSSAKRKDAAVAQKKIQASEKAATQAKKDKTSKPEKVKKPADFDDGGWTTVQSRTDKKKKQDDLLLSQALSTALSQNGKKGDSNKGDTKSSKNPKQLKDQVNKSKKEAADNKNKKSAANDDNSQVNNKVADTIENLVNELKKKDVSETIKATSHKKQKIVDPVADNAAAEKTDDSKPVPEGGVVFNEMEETWTEAKAPKKGKKKARKD